MKRNSCPWCVNPGTDDDNWSDDFCRMHEAEYEGLSLDGLDRRDDEWAAEWADITGYRTESPGERSPGLLACKALARHGERP